MLAPEATITPVQNIPDAGTAPYVGVEGLREFVRAWTEDWADWRIVLEDAVDAGDDRVVAVIHQSGVGKGSGAAVDLRFAMLFTLRDGQVIERRDYATLDEALRAAGRRE